MPDSSPDPLHGIGTGPLNRDPDGRSGGSTVLPWVVGATVVLALAVTAGLFTAYLVASSRAAPTPNLAFGSPTPRTTAPVPSTSASDSPSEAPRRTPTTAPIVTPEPSPFVHVVARRESLNYIASLYCVTLDEILAINPDIRNPDRIAVGDEILIPGTAGCSSPAP